MDQPNRFDGARAAGVDPVRRRLALRPRSAARFALGWALACYFPAAFSQEPAGGLEPNASTPASDSSATPNLPSDPPGNPKTGPDSATGPGSATGPRSAAGPIDFQTDIQPIFAQHCLKCHGPEKRSGGLRLDGWNFASAGGDSGKSILTDSLESNELAARVMSSDRAYRMPKNAPPLSDREIETIKLWIAQGCPWPSASRPIGDGSARPFYDVWLRWPGKFADQYKAEIDSARPYAFAFLAVQLLLLAIGRAWAALQRGRAWTKGRAVWFCKLAPP